MTSCAIWSWDKTGNIPRKICSAQICIQMLRLLTQHVSLNEVAGYSEIAPNSVPLGARPFNSWGVCRTGWFRKKVSCKCDLVRKKRPFQRKDNEKKFSCCRQDMNVACYLFHLPGGLYIIHQTVHSSLAPFRTLELVWNVPPMHS